MPKKRRVGTLKESQHIKRSETLLKSARRYFITFVDHFEKISARKIQC